MFTSMAISNLSINHFDAVLIIKQVFVYIHATARDCMSANPSRYDEHQQRLAVTGIRKQRLAPTG